MRGTFTKHGYVVEVSEREVYAFARSWPGSSLVDHEGSISFSFEPNGDLVDMNPSDIDGSDVAALSEDAQRWAEKQAGFQSAGLSARFGGTHGLAEVKTSADRFSKSDILMLINGERRHQHVYTYESGKALFDVRVDKESDEYRFYKNNKPSEREPHHDAIIKHFGLHQKRESVQDPLDDLPQSESEDCGCRDTNNGNGWFVWARTTSVAWSLTKAEAEKEAKHRNLYGGTHYTVRPADPIGSGRGRRR